MSIASPELVAWLTDLRQKVSLTNPGLAALPPVGWPIPFFGDIRTARVLTIGVNPAQSEFANPARWSAVGNDPQWIHRLLNYFHEPVTPSHEWFRPWEAALRLLGCSYEDRTAAHLDLSPRATTVMSQAPRADFCRMVEGDVHWLFEMLRFTPSARLMLAAGTMITPEPDQWLPIGSYLEQQAPSHGARVATIPGAIQLMSPAAHFSLPLFTFTSGPSARDKFKLIDDVFNARNRLLPHLR